MKRLRNQLIRHEGLKLKPYRCPAGKLTIGVGRNLEDKGITEQEAMRLLNNDIEECEAQLVEALPWFDGLDTVRQDVLINMCFNLGFAGLMKFKRMIQACEKHSFMVAAAEMRDSRWYHQVKGRGKELAVQMQTGRWNDEL